MEHLIPSSYQHFIGSIVLIFAFISLFITFLDKQKSHATKLFSMLLVISLSLFSSHVATYFAAIFIIATAVTELEFLQNLAAIIRKDEHYFKYKQESLSTEDNIKRKSTELIEDELLSERKIKNDNNQIVEINKLQDMSRSSQMKLAFTIEEKALNFLSKTYGDIQQGVRFSKDGIYVEFDGVISKTSENTIFEVKWLKNPKQAALFIIHYLRRFNEMLDKHKEITGIPSKAYIVLVTNEKNSISEKRLNRLKERAKEHKISIIFLSLDELGFEVIPETTTDDS